MDFDLASAGIPSLDVHKIWETITREARKRPNTVFFRIENGAGCYDSVLAGHIIEDPLKRGEKGERCVDCKSKFSVKGREDNCRATAWSILPVTSLYTCSVSPTGHF